jgi:DNA topoisomerase VI subunit B
MSAIVGSARLERTTFTTSRLMEFCTRQELTLQTGHPVEQWPLVILKELVDNALDSCEEAETAPDIGITVADDCISISDNGRGFPLTTLDGVLDFSVRVSSREAYVAPDRGAQGNALKTLFALPFVLDGKEGRVRIESQGEAHDVAFGVDQIRQQPMVRRNTMPSIVKNGTHVKVWWPRSACSYLTDAKQRFLQMAEDYSWLNPHLRIAGQWDDDPLFDVSATVLDWAKWRPSDPTSAHWYTLERFERLVAAYVKHDLDHSRERTVREFVSEFRGFSGSAKQSQVLKATGLARATLSGLVRDDRIDPQKVAALLKAMQAGSQPVKPAALGIIGKEHLARRFTAAGAKPKSFDYRKVVGVTDGLPWVVETAFAWAPKIKTRRIITGVNWSPGINNPFRQLGRIGESLDTILAQQRATSNEPVIFFMHLACPQVGFTDRGKSAVVLPESPR